MTRTLETKDEKDCHVAENENLNLRLPPWAVNLSGPQVDILAFDNNRKYSEETQSKSGNPGRMF